MHVIEGVLGAEDLEWILALVRRSQFSGGAASAHGAAQQVKANQQLECSRADHEQLVQRVFGVLHRNAKFSRIALPLEISVPMVNRYVEGMTYGPHYDHPFMPTPDGPRIRGDLSATLFVSDPQDYDGGELCFARVGGEQRVKLKAGDLFLYPSSTLHHVAPVTRGERLAVVFWVQSMIRDHEKRCMVADLDSLVGRLAERMPGSAEVRDLAGVVGNLTRMWAELAIALAIALGAAVAHPELSRGQLAPATARAEQLDSPSRVAEVRDDGVAVERARGPALVVAVRDAPDRTARGPRRLDVVQRVADDQRVVGPCSKAIARVKKWEWIRLPPRDGVAADDAVEEAREARAREEILREPAGLVGDAAEGEPEPAHPLEAFDDPFERAGASAGLGCVAALKDRQGPREERWLGDAVERTGQRPVDEHGDALADVGRDRRGIARGRAELAEHAVRGGGEIGRGVEQRAVEIEENRADRHPAAPASAARIAAIVAL